VGLVPVITQQLVKVFEVIKSLRHDCSKRRSKDNKHVLLTLNMIIVFKNIVMTQMEGSNLLFKAVTYVRRIYIYIISVQFL
jgi:hypothetical protein